MRQKGFALITVLSMIVVLGALLVAYYMLTRIELGTTKASSDQALGFYAAEAGLNLRAEEIRQRFVGYLRPSGSSPSPTNPCTSGNMGSGDFKCKEYTINGRKVWTYVVESPGNPSLIRIPPGELFENLTAQEYRYRVISVAKGSENEPEAILEMRFKSRLVPLFQFAAFYGKDLEILPGPPMVLEGPVHSNNDLYLNAHNTLDILGQVTTAGDLYRGRKDTNTCYGTVSVIDRTNSLRALPCDGNQRNLLDASELTPWGGKIRTHVKPLTIPDVGAIDPEEGKLYWDKADLRIALDLNGGTPQIKVYQKNEQADSTLSTSLDNCPGSIGGKPVGYSNTFYNNRERKDIQMLEVDLVALLNCAHNENLLRDPDTGQIRTLDDLTEGGLVFHFTVFGPLSDTINPYGVRIRNARELQASAPGAPPVRGLTIVSDQALYIQGDYNAVNKIPAAILADSLNVLSTAWNDDAVSHDSLSARKAAETSINAAFLAGTDLTGGTDGAAGQDQGRSSYNGGLENYPRFHEDWSGVTLHYYGSFVSLGTPKHVQGPWYSNPQYYVPPRRDWHYDVDFNDAANLPPLTPRFVYLRQELFEREFEQQGP